MKAYSRNPFIYKLQFFIDLFYKLIQIRSITKDICVICK